jgi:hypothetical protein
MTDADNTSDLNLQPKTLSSLPIELRLKIYEYILPPKETLRVGIYQISRDGGQYSYHHSPDNIITFAVSSSPNETSEHNTPYHDSPPVSSPRSSPLLRISHETRSFFHLPCGKLGTGLVHFSSDETVYMDNAFGNSLCHLFPALERQKSTLQGIKTLGLEDSAFGKKTRYTIFGESFAGFIALFGDLEVLGCVSWYVDEERMSNREGCERVLGMTREAMVRWKEVNDPWERIRIPEMVVIESW